MQILLTLGLDSLANPITGNIQMIAEGYSNEDNFEYFSTIDKYPIYIRIFGLFHGLILTTTWGVKPSIFTTCLFFSSIIVGILRCYTFDKVVPLFIKLYFLILLFSTVIIISIFPFFSYAKYWLFFLPFMGLFMSFNFRWSIISIALVYLELVFKSSWLN